MEDDSGREKLPPILTSSLTVSLLTLVCLPWPTMPISCNSYSFQMCFVMILF